MPYLLKTEPGKYSFDDLARDGETLWDGISNNQALLNLREMKKGERLVIYHSNVGKAAVGMAEVVSVDASDPRNPMVRIRAGKRLQRERQLAEIRAAKVFQRDQCSAAPPSHPAKRYWNRRSSATKSASPQKA